MCTSVECSVDKQTQMGWIVSVVASPNEQIDYGEQMDYDVLSVNPATSITAEDTV